MIAPAQHFRFFSGFEVAAKIRGAAAFRHGVDAVRQLQGVRLAAPSHKIQAVSARPGRASPSAASALASRLPRPRPPRHRASSSAAPTPASRPPRDHARPSAAPTPAPRPPRYRARPGAAPLQKPLTSCPDNKPSHAGKSRCFLHRLKAAPPPPQRTVNNMK